MSLIILNDAINFSDIIDQGITITIVGIMVVFAALALLVVVFIQIPKILYYNTRKKLKQETKKPIVTNDELHIAGDVNAAISMALHLFFDEMHDEESNVITIQRVRRVYSPWSSKIYGLRIWPRN
jgi:glutaconyl-CoA/methylmalonyl-CoA decarboxylase subunit delta